MSVEMLEVLQQYFQLWHCTGCQACTPHGKWQSTVTSEELMKEMLTCNTFDTLKMCCFLTWQIAST